MLKETIAVYTLSNTIAIAVTEINYTDDTVEWVAVVGNEAVESGISGIQWEADPSDEDTSNAYFMVGAMQIPLSECIRV